MTGRGYDRAPMTRIPTSYVGLSLFWVGLVGTAAAQADAPDFSRDVRPILARYCFKCHGPDEGSRKSEMRLDLCDAATAPAGSGEVPIVPGNAAASELVRRIRAAGDADLMPPPSTKLRMTDAEKDVLERWIAAGAEYRPHWAFVSPQKVELPKVKATAWPKNAVDRFVLADIEKSGLSPSKEADRYALARRLSLDLIGLPPTIEEVDAFIADASPDFYEKFVDRLLSSPHYGERWARRWMDLARYADTNGYAKDFERSIWPWRDWVIRSLNADMPFDRFTIEQLAGDMLPDPRTDQLIATGFHRNTMLNDEGGIDPLEFRYLAMVDRVATTGTAWLGLTLGCAQCHTHKYDPIPHREYFEFMAFLDNADEPDLFLPDPAATERHRADSERAKAMLTRLWERFPLPGEFVRAGVPNSIEEIVRPDCERRAAADAGFSDWLRRERARASAWIPIGPRAATSSTVHLTVESDHSVSAAGDITKSDVYRLKFKLPVRGVTALRLEALPDARLPGGGPGLGYYEGPKGDFFMGEFRLSENGRPLPIARATESYAKNHFGADASAMLAVDGDPQTGWSTAGREGERHEAVFVFAEPIVAEEIDLEMVFGRHYACSLGRFRISVTTQPGGVAASDWNESIERLLLLPDAELAAAEKEALRDRFLLTTPESAGLRDDVLRLMKPPSQPTTLIMRERPPENPRKTFMRRRGEFLSPTDPVHPGVLSAVSSFPADWPRNRLGLARWLVSRDNPLTARVTVNRQWQAFFGRGLVATTDDFGYEGEAPTHPTLLDWLAVEFMEDGWSMKRLHKLIVMSATYRQDSRSTPEHEEKDPENRLLARGPRGRLDAEVIRDAALFASDLLSLKMGGPGVYPPQPADVTEVTFGNPGWPTSTGDDRRRRSVYTFIKRTAPFALFTTFDAPSGESCVGRRDVSNTPLQALAHLNDVVFLEAAQAMGRMLAGRSGSVEDAIRYGFRRALTRPPDVDEIRILEKFFTEQMERLTSGELDALKIAPGEPQDAAGRAAWTLLARLLLNLNEMTTKY